MNATVLDITIADAALHVDAVKGLFDQLGVASAAQILVWAEVQRTPDSRFCDAACVLHGLISGGRYALAHRRYLAELVCDATVVVAVEHPWHR